VKNIFYMKKLECLSAFKESELSFEMMNNVTGGCTATDGGVRPVHSAHSEGGWMVYNADENCGDTTIYIGWRDQGGPFEHLGMY
jgi:hypothetical protein